MKNIDGVMKNIDAYKQSFEAAYDEYFESIFRFFCIRLTDRERAKELSQDTFMRAWKYMIEGNTIYEIRPFLYKTAYNLFKNEIRSRQDVVSLDILMFSTGFEPNAPEHSSMEDLLDARQLVKEIQELPPLYRNVLTLRYIDDLTVREITMILETPQVTISVRLHRGIRLLREAYEYKQVPQTA